MTDMKEPKGFRTWNRALQGAYRKGWKAAIEGKGRESCPYIDFRTRRGSLTWSRSFIVAWEDGWDQGFREMSGKASS